MFIATLIAADRLTGGDISAAEDALRAAGIESCDRHWIDEGQACDLRFGTSQREALAALEGLISGVDVVVQREAERRRRLLVADMDSTMITVECIDELADYAGLKAEISEVTEQAMRGQLDFESALERRVSLLKGLQEAVLARCHDERVRIMPGAVPLVRTMRKAGAYCVLVSGGFTSFADKVAETIGFDRAVANRLGLADGNIDGTVGRPIVGASAKRDSLIHAAAEQGLAMEETLAVGDGANDIPMIEAAGLGVAYHAKPGAAAVADARIEHNDLTALLYAQGYARRDWVPS
jgi:phosphoserine phosphatase